MKKLLKIFSAILILFIIGNGLLYLYSGPYIKKYIANKLDNTKIAGIYKVKVNDGHFNVINMGIMLKDIEIYPDSTAESLEKYVFHRTLAHISIEKISISNVDVMKFIREKKVAIDNIEIIKPQIEIFRNENYMGSALKNDSVKLKNPVDLLALKSIKIQDMSLNYYQVQGDLPMVSFDDLELELVEPVINPNKHNSFADAIQVKDVKLDINKIQFRDPKGEYDIAVQVFDLDYPTLSLKFSDISIKPLLGKTEFAREHPYQSDRFDIKIDNLEVKQIDFQCFLSDHILALAEVKISGLELEVYRDKNRPMDLNKRTKLPQEALRGLKQKFEIERIVADNVNVTYEELGVNADKSGKVHLNDIKLEMTHVGNTENYINGDDMVAQAEGNIYGKGHIRAQFTFPLDSDQFHFSGHMASLPLKSLNEITVDNASITIREGMVDQLVFDAIADKEKSQGTLTLQYHDLEIAMLKEDEKTGLKKEQKILDFVANTVIPEQNPNKRGKLYDAHIYFEREHHKGVFSYLWKSLFSGLKDTILKKGKPNEKSKKKKKSEEDKNDKHHWFKKR